MEHSKKKSKNKKRFSDEQIRSLEAIFETGTKLEPRKKLQVAREVGLEPRQIAIWFQNRRARWKSMQSKYVLDTSPLCPTQIIYNESKQIEKEFKVLKANYDHLSAQFEFLAKEKQSLLIQLQKLTDLLEKHEDRHESSGTGQPKFMSEAKKSTFLQDRSSRSSQQDHEVTVMNGGDCSLGSLEKLCNLESSGGLIDQQPPGNLRWWNLWA